MRKPTQKYLVLLTAFFILLSCKKENESEKEPIQNALEQMTLLLAEAEKHNRIPRTVNESGEMHWTNEKFDWTEGFFTGSCWYLYEFSNDKKWKMAAEKFQGQFEDHKFKTNNHDLGFIFNCSYGNGVRLTNNEDFKKIMITAADALLTRFNPRIGCIQSWDVDSGWQKERGWMFPVIIDNMMNLELLFKVSDFTGDDSYKQVAITHANTTLKNHFRKDNSSFHVVDYDPETGKVRSKETAQGFANESAWARGQAWGLYGYTVCYRFTKDPLYLAQAEHIANYIINHQNLPNDGIPYWDYNASKIPNEPRDVSAAAITVSALLELDAFSDTSYEPFIEKVMNNLASDKYTAVVGENNNFILKHSVGSIPHGAEIDVPLSYADYYYLEALIRTKYKN